MDHLKSIAEAIESAIPDADEGAADAAPLLTDTERPGRSKTLFSIRKFNERYAVVLFGGKAFVLSQNERGPMGERVQLITIGGFREFYANRFTEIRNPAGKVQTVTHAAAWLGHPDRLQFAGMEFYPSPDGAQNTEGYLNLWKGFAFQPKPKHNGWKTLRDHLFENICRGNEQHFDWVIAFFAHMVQRPRDRVGVAMVLRGKQGVGKTVVGQHFGALVRAHYLLVDSPRYLTGRFNAHMTACLLLQTDEGFWAGDKEAEGRIKGLVTSSVQQVEMKGVDPVERRNFVRILVTSNESWVVPAGMEEGASPCST